MQPAVPPADAAGVVVERRDVRAAIEVAIGFRVVDGETTLRGLRLSRRHLVVEEAEAPRARSAMLHVPLSGFELVLPLRLVPAEVEGAADAGVRRYEMVELDARTEATLVQLVRVVTAGWLPTAEDLAAGWDAETPRPGESAAAVRRRTMPWVALVVSLIALVGGVAAIGSKLYADWTTIGAEAAAIIAPRIDLISGEYGTVVAGGPSMRTRVKPGDTLVTVESDEIRAGIETERANLAYFGAAAPDLGAEDSHVGLGPNPLRAELARRRLEALEQRAAALTFRSNCDCSVLWAAAPGTRVAPGMLLMSLMAAGQDQIKAAALIAPADAVSVVSGQPALVRAAGGAEFAASVEAVRYQFAPMPMIGLGDPADGRATVILRFDGPLGDLAPGTPVTVVISR
ncbi:hypothetical protein [Prosthecomicrobium pneumaticum]|uniref:Uncharacterized protein n=1 Tax=Prosthecomicrobium pneumaticum TaxID=81895 RepID=A0A7W9L433_9HYPH|nr:hypothetical protein [Prosthecomicrobium pneumaticum]MBB5755154.1 hypothetical protein [Prosthecomicrobium pneumaticum]